MVKVIRLESGGGSVVEASKLSMEEAKDLAARLARGGYPPRCSWCVELEEDDKKRPGQDPIMGVCRLLCYAPPIPGGEQDSPPSMGPSGFFLSRRWKP
jgi:hypothetical protein